MLRREIFLVIFLLLSSAKCQSQADTTCLNGGLLSSNICICLPGFIGKYCEINVIEPTTSRPSSSLSSSSSSSSSQSSPTFVTSVTSTRSPGALDPLINSISDGFIQGLINFISYYLNLQGIGDVNTLTSQDVEILTDVFVSSLINETETLLQTWKQTSPYADRQDTSIQDKVAHLTANVFFILNLQFNELIKQNITTSSLDLNTVLQLVVNQVLTDLLASVNAPLNDINKLVSDALLNLFSTASINDFLSELYGLVTAFLDALLSGTSITPLSQKRSIIQTNEINLNNKLDLSQVADMLTNMINKYMQASVPFEVKLNESSGDRSANYGLNFKINDLEASFNSDSSPIKKRSSLLKNLIVENNNNNN